MMRGIGLAMRVCRIGFLLSVLVTVPEVLAQEVILDRAVHLRAGMQREWDEFPEQAEAAELKLEFTANANKEAWTLELVQEDVKQDWQIRLNETPLGSLRIDENRMRIYFQVPPAAVIDGQNSLSVSCLADSRRMSDDIRVGPISLHRQRQREVVSSAQFSIKVTDRSTGAGLPARLTILDSQGALQETSVSSNQELAVRPGVIYTSTGNAEFAVPEGRYTIYAGRGFEYSLARRDVTATPNVSLDVDLTLDRQVNTSGWVACDPHIHSLTHSGHGDATVHERMITLAGEGIELPIATDHNVHVNYEQFARQAGVREYFTPVMGNEVTTPVGHFNVFPVAQGAGVPEYALRDWREILSGIYATPDVRIVILNHARDEHSGVRPFGPRHHLARVGENVDGWPIGFNAMEVLNSSATQTEPLQLFEDWMALLNRGYRVTPVGSSDSHDVARHFVGQGRTYIRCDDSDVSQIDLAEAVDNFRQGQVYVSYGLLVDVVAQHKYRPGEFLPLVGKQLDLDLRVLAPDWIRADRVALYMNGSRIREAEIHEDARDQLTSGVVWTGNWRIDLPSYDVNLVVMAEGPGIREPYWRTAKPYQPLSPAYRPRVFGCSGPLWVDADDDGQWMSAYDYAQQLIQRFGNRRGVLVDQLIQFDDAVAMHVAHRLHQSTGDTYGEELQKALSETAPRVQAAFQQYAEMWRTAQRARVEQP